MPLPVPTSEHAKRLHRRRIEKAPQYPDIKGDPELASAYHSLQLHWLANVPGYREEIKRKLNEVATAAEKKAQRIEFNQRTVYGERLSQALRDDQLERLAGY